MSDYAVTSATLAKIATYGRVFSSETRLRILWELTRGEKCVQDLANCLHMTDSAISHQLRELREVGILKTRRDGKKVFYFYKDERARNQIIYFTNNIN